MSLSGGSPEGSYISSLAETYCCTGVCYKGGHEICICVLGEGVISIHVQGIDFI